MAKVRPRGIPESLSGISVVCEKTVSILLHIEIRDNEAKVQKAFGWAVCGEFLIMCQWIILRFQSARYAQGQTVRYIWALVMDMLMSKE